MKTDFKFVCSVWLEKEEISTEDKLVITGLIASIKFNYVVLEKDVEERKTLEKEMLLSEEERLEAEATHKNFKVDIHD